MACGVVCCWGLLLLPWGRVAVPSGSLLVTLLHQHHQLLGHGPQELATGEGWTALGQEKEALVQRLLPSLLLVPSCAGRW